MCRITDHAVARYQQRIEPCDEPAARVALTAAGRVVDIAAGFGAPVVVMGNGARLILNGDVVVTVLAPRRGKRPERVRRAPRFDWIG